MALFKQGCEMMNKNDFKERLPDFIIEQSENEKSHNTLKKYKHNIELFIEWMPDDTDIDKTIMIDFKRHLLDDLHYRTNTINNYIVHDSHVISACTVP